MAIIVIFILVLILVLIIIQNLQQKKVIKMLKGLILIDPLTRLANQRWLKNNMPRIIKGAIRQKKSLSLIMFDLDHLKKLNDTYGHPAVNKYFQAFAGEMTRICSRPEDVVIRWGGDEFLVILPDTDSTGAGILAEEMRKVVSDMNFFDKDEKTTISLGVFTTTDLTHEVIKNSSGGTIKDIYEKIIARADSLLYQAKKAGRDKAVSAKATLKEVLA